MENIVGRVPEEFALYNESPCICGKHLGRADAARWSRYRKPANALKKHKAISRTSN